MPRKSSRGRGPRSGPNSKSASRNPTSVSGSEIPHGGGGAAPAVTEGGAAATAEALDRLGVSAGAEVAPVEMPPLEAASSSGRDEVCGSLEEEAVRKLQELVGLGGEEVELTEDEAAANDQRQEDEIFALEAIFGDNIVIFNKKEGQRSFQVHVHIEIPDGIDVSARLNYGSGSLKYGAGHDADASDNLVYKFRVEHLPPILLTCLLPSSYPSHQPPLFTIFAEWMNKMMISSLCQMLDTVWEEQRGMEVTYQWVQWLQISSLSHLGFANEILLSSDSACDRDHGDKRALSHNALPDVIIPRMMRCNDDKCHEAFLRAIHDCMICFTEFPGTDFIKLPCHHFFCSKCMQTYCKMHVKEGTVLKLLCPDAKCGGVVPPNILKSLLGEEEFDRWEGLLLRRTLDSMSDVVYCPRCETACLEDADNDAVCSSCLFSFCTLCRDRRHVGETCMVPEEKLLILEKRQEAGALQEDQLKFLNELRSIKTIMKDSKMCPRCKMAISKTEGCNKMSCCNCGQYFCYQCNMAIDGYEHFRGSCVLFPQEEIDRWEMRMNPRAQRQVVAQVQAEMFRQYAHPCPTCRQPCPKVGNNNHVFCWACQKHFCALCRKPVHKTSQHFGPKGCKQHTTDP
ncbi:E3 ubiquitin-protein ligase RNF14-like isoform X1 [Oryza brachyantha]|uniref:E3 ubiquitin-protein ligase RNF14-like isoform X1 n=1 Tax=Oryza brachyantha TaxID=4533 RepID=UPI001ADBAA69|nr:E3 ubiquitin-protein ligase RNF14-like isoform X1 [Oryza brachyantha]